MDERLLTPGDVAAPCQISAKSVLRAIHRGQLRAYRLGERGAYRLRERDVDAWLEQAIVAPATPSKLLSPAAPVVTGPVIAGRLRLTPDMGRSRDGRAA